mgnify:FL=1
MKVCILGSGVMGSGIVSLFSQLEEVSEILWWGQKLNSLEVSLVKVKKEVTRYAKKNSLSKEFVDKFLLKIRFCSSFSDLTNCDLYIEAIVEELEAKSKLFSELSEFIPGHAVVATNTSSLSVTALAMRINIPSNFIGIHFFNPTSVMKLVEVVKGLTTSKEIFERVIKVVKALDKVPVVVNESPGFIVNRMLIPMINEAVSILAEGVGSKEDIDNAMKYGANHPIGPLALSDLIGNDVCLSIMEALHSETGDSKYRAHPLLRQYVRAGFLGRKSKKGFFEY